MALAVRTQPQPSGSAARSERAHELFRRAEASVTAAERCAVMNAVVEIYLDYAHGQAQRYAGRGVPLEDLRQVAALALIKAVHRYDVDSGHHFLSFAGPTIRGELRKHFRDLGWMIRPTRGIQELRAQLRIAEADLFLTLARPPRPTELAEHLDVTVESVIEALATNGCFAPTTLDLPVGEGGVETLGDLLPADDHDHRALEVSMMLRPVLPTLDERDRLILSLRFDDDLTQREIAGKVGVSQEQVSRILKRIFTQLRQRIGNVVPR